MEVEYLAAFLLFLLLGAKLGKNPRHAGAIGKTHNQARGGVRLTRLGHNINHQKLYLILIFQNPERLKFLFLYLWTHDEITRDCVWLVWGAGGVHVRHVCHQV